MSDEPNPFAELLERASRGDEAAWQVLWDEYMPLVKIVLRRRLRRARQAINQNPSDPFDEVWLHVLPKLGELRFESPEQLTSYFLACAENLLRQELRGRHPLPPPELPEPDDEPSVGERWSVLEALAQQESLDEVRSRLSPEELNVLELRAAGHRWTAIARTTGSTANRVRCRVQRILQRLRGAQDGDTGRAAEVG
jgi:RNA polymerase sigma factor (sigma-70 family)